MWSAVGAAIPVAGGQLWRVTMGDRAEPGPEGAAGPNPKRARPRVLHVAQPTEAGVAVYVAAAVADQLARGWDVTVACPDGGRLTEELTEAGVRRVRWEAGRSPGPATLAEAAALHRIIRAVGPDVIHLHSSKAGLAGRLAVRGRIPTIFQPHGWSWLAVDGSMASATLAWERWAARWTGLFVCVGAAEAAQGERHGLNGHYSIIRNGVDLTWFEPADRESRMCARATAGVGQDVPLVVCVGRVTRQKGQDVLVRAWPAIRAASPQAELVIVGDGDLLPDLRRLETPGVRFVAGVRDVRPWYAAADVVVLPSRWEGLSLTAMEALASGRPVVASDIDGLAEVVGPDVGALVPPGDPAALAEEIGHRLRDGLLLAQESATAARRAGDFDLRDTLQRLAGHTAMLAGRAA